MKMAWIALFFWTPGGGGAPTLPGKSGPDWCPERILGDIFDGAATAAGQSTAAPKTPRKAVYSHILSPKMASGSAHGAFLPRHNCAPKAKQALFGVFWGILAVPRKKPRFGPTLRPCMSSTWPPAGQQGSFGPKNSPPSEPTTYPAHFRWVSNSQGGGLIQSGCGIRMCGCVAVWSIFFDPRGGSPHITKIRDFFYTFFRRRRYIFFLCISLRK